MRSKQMWMQMKEAIIRLKNKNKPIRETAKAQIRISQKTSEQKKNTWIEAKSLWFSHIFTNPLWLCWDKLFHCANIYGLNYNEKCNSH